MVSKKGGFLHHVIFQIILVVLIFAVFLISTADKINARGVRQQVVEKELAMLLDSAVPGMSFSVFKANVNGVVNDIKIKKGRIYVSLDGLNALNGYGYFSKYSVSVVEEDDKFVVSVK